MAFRFIQSEVHQFGDKLLIVRYHRITTKLEIEMNGDLILSAKLYFSPLYRKTLEIEGEEYQLSIFWMIFWRSKLAKQGEVEIKELFPQRRRKSVIAMGYVTTMACLKVFML